MQKRLYPIGQQDFPELINDGKVYVDKTMYAYTILTTNKYYFLSRPRRFGKSLFISTLESIFKGNKSLFEGLYIHDKWKFEEYPIIRISFSNIGYRTMGLSEAIAHELDAIGSRHQIKLKSEKAYISSLFRELIVELQSKYNQNVVILIDEYDKPIIDYLDKEKIDIAKQNRDILKTFYSILKDADPYLKLVFVTGVSKFSKVSIFSDLNNLNDISLDLAYNEICGISQKELEEYFPEELKLVDAKKMREWYNGYKFHIRGTSVYNPFSTLNFFQKDGDFQNFWYTTGTPTFLMKMCRAQHFYKFDEVIVNAGDLSNFDIENLQILPILFQTGYITITGENALFRNYKLSFPNLEVKDSYLRNLADVYIDSPINTSSKILQDLMLALQNKDSEALKATINLAFAQIPYSLWQKENEQFFHAIVHLLFSLMSVYIFSKVHTKSGRADAVVMYQDHIYCLEFKLNKSATQAIQQLESKAYTERFLHTDKHLHHIGINFNSDKKAVDDVLWHEVK
ncbi:MAG TPA: AAA family ATPase [Saprospiraceae bacterium]|nr:AAA family ATPase [Saprospiraceae bacterium]